jgi:hypothetical protein
MSLRIDEKPLKALIDSPISCGPATKTWPRPINNTNHDKAAHQKEKRKKERPTKD